MPVPSRDGAKAESDDAWFQVSQSPGSMGAKSYPGRSLQNEEDAWPYGAVQRTIINVEVVGVDAEKICS